MSNQKEIEEYISLKKNTNNEEHQPLSSRIIPKLKRYCSLFQPKCERNDYKASVDSSVDEIDGVYGDARERKRPLVPFIMISFSVLQLILFFTDILYVENSNKRGPCEIALSYNPFKRYQAWRFLTYIFVHKGYSHIISNLFFQLVMGIALEYIYGWWRVTLLYLAGVVANVIGVSILSPEKYILGSSGGVYALLAAYLFILLLNWKEMELALMQTIIFFILIVVDVGVSFNSLDIDPEGSVGYMGHLFGAIAGILVGILILRYDRCGGWQMILWWCTFSVYILVMFVGVLFHILYAKHFATGPKYSVS